MPEANSITVELAFADAMRQELISMTVPVGTTVGQVIEPAQFLALEAAALLGVRDFGGPAWFWPMVQALKPFGQTLEGDLAVARL
jgi:hypothetical protein